MKLNAISKKETFKYYVLLNKTEQQITMTKQTKKQKDKFYRIINISFFVIMIVTFTIILTII